MKVFLINGVSLAGKDTFVRCLEQLYLNDGQDRAVMNLSTINPIKNVYQSFFGWKGNKSPEHRKNLNTLKNVWRSCSNGPVEYIRGRLNEYRVYSMVKVVFVMVREYEEMVDLQKLCYSLKISCSTMEVIRDGLEIPPVEQEFLDSHPKGYKYDFTINNPTVPDYPFVPVLQEQAEYIFKWVEGKLW